MANRMEIELTSARDEESYTWRAAGARQPRGVIPRSLLPAGCKVGDVFRVEVEIEIDGISIISVLPSKERASAPNTIEHIGPPRPPAGVTTVLAGRAGRGRPNDRNGDRPPRRRDSSSAKSASERTGSGERRRSTRESPRGGERGGERPRRSEAARTEERPPATVGRERAGRRRVESAGVSQARPRRGPQRFEPGTVHLDELLASLTPEQRPIAERLASGGLPSVRKALTEEQQRARAEGRPAASGDPIIALAEELLPQVKAATWLDRAEAAVEKPDEITLRDLRTTVVGAAPRDEAGRELARRLREALDKRVAKLRQDWEDHLTQALSDGRVLQALRLSARPPEPSARFPGALVPKLAEQAGQAMTEETSVERWLALLDAAVQSPVRRQIRPAGMPKDTAGEVERQARTAASRIPAIARLLGMAIPPPPKPVPGERPPRPPLRHGRRPPSRPSGPPVQDRPPRSAEGPDGRRLHRERAALGETAPSSTTSDRPKEPLDEHETEPPTGHTLPGGVEASAAGSKAEVGEGGASDERTSAEELTPARFESAESAPELAHEQGGGEANPPIGDELAPPPSPSVSQGGRSHPEGSEDGPEDGSPSAVDDDARRRLDSADGVAPLPREQVEEAGENTPIGDGTPTATSAGPPAGGESRGESSEDQPEEGSEKAVGDEEVPKALDEI